MVFANSEINQLEKVKVHRPDAGIARISPKKTEVLLFDDIVHLPLMQQEHDIFTAVLKKLIGEDNVLETEQLLEEALAEEHPLKEQLIDRVLQVEELPKSYGHIFNSISSEALCDLLITGYDSENDVIYFDPIPNFIFTRDIAITVLDHVIITKAAKETRFRENILTRFIFLVHPMFAEVRDQNRLINLNNLEIFPPSKKGDMVSIEGGDMMIIDGEYLLIGCSERTNAHAFHSLRKHLNNLGLPIKFVKVNIPNDRSCMHIDTLFTRIDKDVIACYKPIVYDGLGSNVELYDQGKEVQTFSSVKDFFLEKVNPNMKFVFSGNGESPYQEREQWTDGCNLVTIRPGLAITYDRNPYTDKSFEANGFKMVTALDYLSGIEKVDGKTIITLPSSELSRARGGSHCMSCPIVRRKM